MPPQSGEGLGNAVWVAPQPDHVARWRQPGEGLKVGICWNGSLSNQRDGTRSVDVASLSPLFDVPGVTWHSLQVGKKASECPEGVINHADEIGDFHDMAALIANLDLVISVDTAVANLAGSMGAPLWVLGEFDPDFRWTGEGDKTPWFPTARVFRQEKVGEWGPVIERVRCEVRDSMTIKTACEL